MEFLCAVLGGISCKLYDDLNDNHLIGPHIQEILKGSQWILLALLSYNDFNFAVVNLIANAGNALNNWGEWNHPYETSLLCLAPLFVVISASTAQWLSICDYTYATGFIGLMAVEPLFIKEEFSYRKLLVRIWLLISCVAWIPIAVYNGMSTSLMKVNYYIAGYFLISSCFQAYMLWKKNESVSVEEG